MSSAQPIPPLPALSELDLGGAELLARERGLPAYRGRQLREALTRHGDWDIEDVSSLPVDLRRALAANFRTRSIEPKLHLVSKQDGAEKVLFGLHDGMTVESVLIRSRGERPRATICVSSQVGCPAACSFCATGLAGFSRNLTATEIVDQVMYFVGRLRLDGRRATAVTRSTNEPNQATPAGLMYPNVVFMGMGEPLLNAASVREAVARLTDPSGLALGDRRITVSTVGIVPQIRKFADWAGQVNLAVSLHAPNDELRSQLVPYNRHFPISDVLDAVQEYVSRTHRRVSFEYVLLRGTNDAPGLAAELAALLRPLGGMAHVNLIPWNPFREGKFVRSEGPDAEAFAAAVRGGGTGTTIRYSKGLDISAACGQLREQVANEKARVEATHAERLTALAPR